MTGGSARLRRSSAELHALILRAAEELFGARGYEATTTRDIAVAAEVTEAAIYRHFGTKEALFEAAIARPYREVIGSFLRSWQRRAPGSNTNNEVTREFVERFYDFVQEHRRLLKAYLTYREYNPQEGDSALSRELDHIESAMRNESASRGFPQVDIPIAVRCAAGMVLALALHDDLLFPAGAARPHRDRVVAEAVAFALHGVSAR
ncbi:MAG TPA: helix-turn-helix domain-containing protein [Pseudonocardia sp.]|jgi:AcrR family transcriptional regulator|nr:helix-turn-helix domain-containing protein [Pseudonocardia sp.]